VTTDWRACVIEQVDSDREAMLDLLSAMVRVPSVSGSDEENSAQAELAAVLDASGLEVDHWQVPLEATLSDPSFPGVEVPRSEAWGLVARLPGRGEGPSLMFNGHIDVVPAGPAQAWHTGQPYSGIVKNGALHGRGACDMKGGLVAAWWAVSALQRCGVPLRGDVLLASVQGEEDGGLGSFATLQRGWRAEACVIPEPTSLGVVPANAGALTFRLRIPGLATHASRHLEGISAVGKLWPIWTALLELERVRNEDVHALFERWELPYPICIGTVSSGVWASSVPDLLVAEGRMGVALGEPVEQARRAFEDAVAEACEANPWLRDHPVEVEWWGGQFASGQLSDPRLLDRVQAAHAFVTHGARQDVWAATYGSDLRLMEGAGIPTLQYGPGDAALAHSTDENVPVDEVLDAARTLAVLALDVCGVQGRARLPG